MEFNKTLSFQNSYIWADKSMSLLQEIGCESMHNVGSFIARSRDGRINHSWTVFF